MSATWVEGNQKSVVSSMPSSSSLAYLRILDETFSSDIVFLDLKFFFSVSFMFMLTFPFLV